MDKTPLLRINYPEPGDWVITTKEKLFCCCYATDDYRFYVSGSDPPPIWDRHEHQERTETVRVECGAVGHLIRETNYEDMRAPQNSHMAVTYIVDIAGVERRFQFGEVIGCGLLDQMIREAERG